MVTLDGVERQLTPKDLLIADDAGPIGLAGGDRRRWTHEVRIPDRVFVRTAQLQAVFARTALVGGDPAIENLFRWCELQGVDFLRFDTPRGNDFETLQRECALYIRRNLLSSSQA